MKKAFLGGLIGVLLPVALAWADDNHPRGAPEAVSEVRIGALANDVGFFGGQKEEGVLANAEILFQSPEILHWLWAPRPHIGGSLNASGDTSQLYIGATWDYDITDWLFVEFSLGGAIHDGELDDVAGSDRKGLGCRVLFRESASLGWRINEHHSISLMFDHISNANLCDHNEGLDTLGIRYGYRF